MMIPSPLKSPTGTDNSMREARPHGDAIPTAPHDQMSSVKPSDTARAVRAKPAGLLTGAALLTTGHIFGQGCNFLRSVIVARTLSKGDFGIASIYLLAIFFVEMGSNLNIERLLVQAPDGDRSELQGTGQLLRFLQGLVVSFLLVAISPVLCEVFHLPASRPVFYTLAILPLFNGLVHFDPFRLHRVQQFKPSVLMEAGSQAASLLVVLTASYAVKGPTLVLWGLFAQYLTLTAMSHLVAERRYVWAIQPDSARRMFGFGWPLMLNGLLLYLVFHGDKLILGSSETIAAWTIDNMASLRLSSKVLGKADLADYSLAIGLTIMPTLLVGRVSTALLLPGLSRMQHDRAGLERACIHLTNLMSTVALALAVLFIVAGTPIVVLIYSESYRSVAPIIGWLGAMQALRILRMAPTITAMSLADTKNALYANLARLLAIAGVFVSVAIGADLAWIAISSCAGELAALCICLGLLRAKHGIGAASFLRAVAFVGVGVSLAMWLSGSGCLSSDPQRAAAVAVAVPLVAVLGWLSFRPSVASLVRYWRATSRLGAS